MPGTLFRGAAVASALLLMNAGCTILAKKPPTPAAQLDGNSLPRTAPPGERYYLLLFGSQDLSRRPAYTHTWGTLVRAIEAPGCASPTLEVHTISWLPTTLKIQTLSFNVEPGTNVELHDTIKHTLATKQDIAMWGPYEVSYPFATRFLTQKAFLDSGAIGYQCIDGVGEAGRNGNGSDCIHAISDMDPEYARWRYPLAFYGQPATANLVRRFMHRPAFVEPRTTHDWLISQLGLTGYPIKRRTYHGLVVPYDPDATPRQNRSQPLLRAHSDREGGEATPCPVDTFR